MKNFSRVSRRWAISVAAVAALAGLLAGWSLPAISGNGRTMVPVLVSSVNAQNPETITGTFAPVVRKAMPAVVNISSSRVTRAPRSPFFESPFGDLFGGDPFGGAPRERRESGLGSGVIVNPDGYILTNNHVIERATEITVTLSNDKREFPAKVIGTDPPTDLALLKIEAKNLPVLVLSDSDKVKIGDLALAIGNPFGLGETVTMGIISALGRSGINPQGYESFIQTDAAINPGNSGGALINTNGELIGINTAIISRSGGFQGIGFAVPSNMARMVMEQLLQSGKVTRGYIGVGIQEVTPAMARAFGMKEPRGVAVTSVEPGSPAAQAGIETGDVIVSFNGEPVSDLNAFRNRVAAMGPGAEIRLGINRDGKEQSLNVKLAELPTQMAGRQEEPARGPGGVIEGVSVETLSAEQARRFGFPAGIEGVVVTQVAPSSKAYDAGLRPGDVIVSVNRRPVKTVAEYAQAVRQAGDPVLLRVNRRGQSLFVAVERK